MGVVEFEDLESGERLLVNTQSKKFPDFYRQQIQSRQSDFEAQLRLRGIDHIKFDVRADVVHCLESFMHQRERRKHLCRRK